MKVNLIVAAVEYFAERGNSWPIARLNAAIAIAVYLFLNVLTLIGVYYAITSNVLQVWQGLDRLALAVVMAFLVVAAWGLSPFKEVDGARNATPEKTARKVMLKFYSISTLVAFIASVAFVIMRISV
jgi:hypothetical protein